MKMTDIKGTIYNGMGGYYSLNKHTDGDGRSPVSKKSSEGSGNYQTSEILTAKALLPTLNTAFTEWVSKLPFDVPTEYPTAISSEVLKSLCARVNARKVYYVVRISNSITRLS